ncbi:FAD-dependent oxidoreductase [Streptosporangium sp. NPDC006013]|uniref:NAD(P)/FAD-dependent oxidoreductase n=1 Tax=Streptosporangium sp. NPDC006013 TaxID=3155596 RepID=UPI0033BD0EB6
MNEHRDTVVVVGASAAGLATATALRRGGHEGTITVLGDEPDAGYDRPPLSKQYLTGGWAADRLRLVSDDGLRALRLDLRGGVRAVGLDVAGRTVLDDQGDRHHYDQLVIATGLRPRRIPALDAVGAHVLRTLDDAARLRDRLRPGLRMLVVGAGFLGLETAATAARAGLAVTVVEPVERPLAARIGEEASARLLALHRAHGVVLRVGATVVDARRNGDVTIVRLSDGDEIAADVVLVAVGSVPCTEWLAGSGLDVRDGVLGDAYCAVADRVWAAGDVARWMHLGYGRHLRLEHRTNATEQGRHVAASILGHRAPFLPVPFFWTDHFDARVQVAGIIGPDAEETREEIPGRPGAALHLFHEGGRLTAVLAWNAARELGRHRGRLLEGMTLEGAGS